MKLEELKKELETRKKHYAEELKRRDNIIDELKEQNTLLMKSALNQSKKIVEITERLKKTK